MDVVFSILIYILLAILALVSFVSGILLIVRSFFGFRAHINRSLSLDLEIVRVSKEKKQQPSEKVDERQ